MVTRIFSIAFLRINFISIEIENEYCVFLIQSSAVFVPFNNFKRQPSSMKFISESSPARTMWAFIAFTIVQLLLFVFYPSVYSAAAGDMDKAPAFATFRLIGIKEVGLMTIYSALTLAGDKKLMFMTVVGRSMVVPFMCWVILSHGAPTSVLVGIIQDVSFGAWTAYTISKSPNGISRPVEQNSVLANACRASIFIAGFVESYSGYLLLSEPVAMLRDQPKWAMSFKRLEDSVGPVHMGVRSVGFMSFVMGGYQMYIALSRASRAVYMAVGLHHLAFALGVHFLSSEYYYEADVIRASLSVPIIHPLFAGGILFFSCTLFLCGKGASKAKEE